MKARRLGLYLAIPAIAAFAYLDHVWKEPAITDKDKTIQLLRYCEWLQSDSKYMTHAEFAAFLRTNESDGLSLCQIFAVMKAFPRHSPERIVDDTNIQLKQIPMLTDGWSNSLNLIWRGEATNGVLNRSLLAEDGPVLIWSSGANGSNEYGNGDDLFITNGE